MGVTSGIVLYAMLWFASFLTIIPFGLQTQGDVGEIVEGTQAGAPHHHNLKKKAWLATAVAAALWVMIFCILYFELITLRDIDFFNRMGPPES